jgi:predicted nucleic acid-binding protein
MRVFVDSNVPMYVAGRDHPNREPSRRFLQRVRAGDVEACTSTEVLQEILYRYSGLRRPDLAAQVYDLFVQLCPVIFAVTLADTDKAKAMLVATARMGVRDAIHAAVMANNDVRMIATFATAFDGIPGVSRLPLV